MDEAAFCRLPEIGFVRLDDLPVHVWLPNRISRITRITQSPYYRSLNENAQEIFVAYQETMRGLPTASSEISWEQFLDLKEDIAHHGLRDTGSPITVTQEGQVDGHHRLAILCYLYGPKTELWITCGVVTHPHIKRGRAT